MSITIDGTTGVTFPDGSVEGACALGYTPQAWTAFTTTTRASGTPYTNSTGRPIMFCISGGSSGTSGSMVIVVSGVTVINQSWGSYVASGVGVSVVIPAGATYTYTNTGYTINAIAELR